MSDGVYAPGRIYVPKLRCRVTATEEASMNEVIIIGMDLAKTVFQTHRLRSDGGVAFRKTVPCEGW